MVLRPTSSRTFAINSPQLLRNVFATSVKDLLQACNLKQANHATVQSSQTQSRLSVTRELECFKQGGDARGVNKGDLRQIHDDGSRWLSLQDREQAIAKHRRGIEAHPALQAHECVLFAVLYVDIKAVVARKVSRQGNSPRSLIACMLPFKTNELYLLIFFHASRLGDQA